MNSVVPARPGERMGLPLREVVHQRARHHLQLPDRHVNNQRRNKVAIMWRGETEGEEEVYTYRQPAGRRCRQRLKEPRRRQGRPCCIYMPVVPEQIIAMPPAPA